MLQSVDHVVKYFYWQALVDSYAAWDWLLLNKQEYSLVKFESTALMHASIGLFARVKQVGMTILLMINRKACFRNMNLLY